VWFCPVDYDLLWKKYFENVLDELFKTWRDTGLINEKGEPRPALFIWDAWLKLPVREEET